MKSIDLTPLYRNSIGFEPLAQLLNDALFASTPQDMPAYNIESLSDNRYSITVAVPGFAKPDLNLQVEKGVLTVEGRRAAQSDRKLLHQGIASSPFKLTFRLADYVEVTDAALNNGLLEISLRKELPEAMKPKKIAIADGSAKSLEHQNSSQAA